VKTKDLLRTALVVSAITLWASVNPLAVQAGPTVYVAGVSNEFGTLDLTTGAFTRIGTMFLPGGDAIFGMGFGADGKLYGLDSQTNANLWSINVTNGDVTNIGPIGQSVIGSTADAAGKMFALSQSANNSLFFTLNPPSLATNVVGPTGIQGDGLAAVNAAGTAMFAGIVSGLTDHIASVDLKTGIATDLGNSGFSLFTGLFVHRTLYGFDGNNFAIVTIDTTTGAGTQVGTYSLPNGDAIDAVATPLASAVPEPPTAALGLCATGVLGSFGVMRHRRRSHDHR
jgi:hypothetical protein